MLRSMKELQGYKLLATNGQIGHVREFYFDDDIWTIRYLVADTGSWLHQKLVLISPVALQQPDWASELFPVNLSKDQIEKSPDIEEDKPVSRQHEMRLSHYYDWPLYWTSAGMVYAGAPVALPPSDVDEEGIESKEETEEEDDDSSLRSSKEVMSYHIRAKDGDIGHVEDLILDDETWIIRYIAVNTRNWLPGKKVLLAPAWIEGIDWAGAQVHIDATQEGIKNSPEYDPSIPINREYEERLYDFYGRPRYWL